MPGSSATATPLSSTPVPSYDAGEDSSSTMTLDETPGRKSRRRDSLLRRWFSSTNTHLEQKGSNDVGSNSTPSRFQDKLLTMLLEQIVPKDGEPEPDRADPSSPDFDRPNFSLPTMSHNFRRFNARIGVVFVFQNQVLRLLAWKKPTQSLTLLAVYSLVCLNPGLLPVLPFVLCIVFVMVPAFLARHSPDSPESELSSPTEYINSLAGPPVAPAAKIKPVAELSKEFFRNIRDLQNVMEDFSRGYDLVVNYIAPPLNFSDEFVSSALFVVLLGLMAVVFFVSDMLPWRFILLLTGWVVICAGSPHVRIAVQVVAQTVMTLIRTHGAEMPGELWDGYQDEPSEDQDFPALSSELRQRFKGFADPEKLGDAARQLARADIDLLGGPEKRQVEIFELQYRPLFSPSLHPKELGHMSMPSSPSAITHIPSSLVNPSYSYSASPIPESNITRRGLRQSPSRSRRNSRHSCGQPDFQSCDNPPEDKDIYEQFTHQPYEPYLFSPLPFIPLSPARISGQMPQGTRRFEDVLPPEGWEWAGKKWILDLDSTGWVEDRCVTNVEVEVEGERWVWDLITPDALDRRNRNAKTSGSPMWADGEDIIPEGAEEASHGPDGYPTTHDGAADGREPQRQDLEREDPGPNESSKEANAGLGSSGPRAIRGEWRRRRWIRWVKRSVAAGMEDQHDWSTEEDVARSRRREKPSVPAS